MNLKPRAETLTVVTAAEQKRIDRQAFADGVPEQSLMESAGRSVTQVVIRDIVDTLPSRTFAVIAGAGGNGGDAVVAAGVLAKAGYTVETYLAFPPERMTPAAAFHARALIEQTPGNVHVLPEEESDLRSRLLPALRSSCCVIDGLLGSGTTRAAEGRIAEIIAAMNHASGTVVSIDLPSGIPADDGSLIGPAVTADDTVAMHFLKPAHVLHPARRACGRLHIAGVAYPQRVLHDVKPIARVPGLDALRSRLPERPETGHKGRFGRVLVVAGSRGMTGAAILCCRAALRVGSGLVMLACPSSLEPVFEATLPEVITVPLPERDGVLAGIETSRFRDVLATADALAVGPGLSRHPLLTPMVERLVAETPVPVVLDADGLWAFSGRPERIAQAQGERILTPHPGEMARLLDLSVAEIEDARLDIAREAADAARATVVLKGVPTVVSRPTSGSGGGATLLSLAGNHGLATGGSGDVLTGLIAGLIAQRTTPCDAAILGAWLHARCADLYADGRSSRSLLPSDVINMLPHVLYSLEHSGPQRSDRKAACG